jgi:hypothetical protein
LNRRAEWTAAANSVLAGGDQVVVAGDRDGVLWQDNIGDSDGLYGVEPVLTLTGAQTVRLLTASAAGLPTSGDGIKGTPFIVLYANGTVAYGKAASGTSTTITPCVDLAVAPAAGDQVVLGGIHGWARTGFFALTDVEQTTLRDVVVPVVKIASGDFHLSAAYDSGTFALPSTGWTIGDFTATKPREFNVQKPGYVHAIQIQTFKPGPAWTIRPLTFVFHGRERDSS